MLKTLYRYGLILLALLVASPAFADHERDPAKRAEVEQRVRQMRSEVLRKQVGLDDKKAQEVEVILDQFHAERRQLSEELRKHRHALRDLVSKDSADRGAYARALSGIQAAEDKLHMLHKRQHQALAKLMAPKEQAKFELAIHQMRRRLRKALQKYGHGDNDD
jgi:Spy/CpxP family protein refolding chaperone